MTTERKYAKNNIGLKNNKTKRKKKRSGEKNRAKIVMTNGCFAGLEIALKKNRTSFGSDINCDVCLDHAFVSPEHAYITKTGDLYIIEDLNSRHGTSIQGKEIHRIKLKNGDVIEIGNFKMKFYC